ncbi:hypothetical protein GCM10010149_92700 [Nonomuraea roseoviolacea subsp. roseoviolacea]|uniref:hypothetical protein n=1 Tax=Nonomuraea roseoviolacea TaxID=103837 RepID=UPI0031D0239E
MIQRPKIALRGERPGDDAGVIASRDRTPDLADADRELLGDTLRRLRRVIGERGDGEQWLSQMRAALDGEGLERPDRPNRPEARR